MNFNYNIIYHFQPGFVIRVALILERRGFEVESLNITPSEKAGFSEMLLKVKGDPAKSTQITKQIAKLVDVLFVEEVQVLEYSTI